MKQPPFAGIKPALIMLCILLFQSLSYGQTNHIDWTRDTVSKSDALGARDTYVNTIRGSGQLATEWIKLPVDKMKDILDACNANGLTEITVLIVAIREADIARFRRNNPEVASTTSKLKGRQMLVFKIPRKAFVTQGASKANLTSGNPIMISLAAAGLSLLNTSYLDIPAGGDDIYFSIGTICPPPASCDY